MWMSCFMINRVLVLDSGNIFGYVEHCRNNLPVFIDKFALLLYNVCRTYPIREVGNGK